MKLKLLIRVMRLLILFTVAGLMHVSAATFSQTITLKGKSVPLAEVFNTIRQQTGLGVYGFQSMFDGTRPVTVDAENMPLEEFLAIILINQPLEAQLENSTIVLSRKRERNRVETLLILAYPEVRGRVVDSLGRPLQGATIRVMIPDGSGRDAINRISTTTVSDRNGEFILRNVPEDKVLEVTFIGYEMQLLKVAPNMGVITLKPSMSAFDEVEVVYHTGYQDVPKERATGAYDFIDPTLFKKRPVSNISTVLQGLVPGMQANEALNGTMNFSIRGTSTLGGNNQPLVVVDGFPISGSGFANINPNDVESISILKDAAAASIWGARSGNGVIVIVTKQGKRNAQLDKVVVEANAFTRIADRIDLDQVLNQASAADMIAYERLAYQRSLFFPAPYVGAFSDMNKPLTLAGEMFFANRFGQVSEAQLNKSLDSLAQINNHGQIQDLLMQRGMVTQANITLSTTTEKMDNYTSLLYENRDEGFKFRGYDRVLLHYNSQYRPASFITFGLNTNIQFQRTDASGTEVGELLGLSPYETLLNPDGSYSTNIHIWNREQLSLLPLASFPYPDWGYNLLREVMGRQISTDALNARIQTNANVRLAKGLNWDTRFQYERNTSNFENYHSEETFYTRNLVNTMVEYNNATRTVGRQFIPKGGILRSSESKLEGFVFRSQLNFDRTWVQEHQVSALGGMELTRNKTTGAFLPYVYGYSPELNRSAVPPYGYGSSVDIFRNFMNMVQTLPGTNPEYEWMLDKFVSFYGNSSYTFRRKYTVTGSARSDASNYITDDPTLRWAPMWSVGGLWHIDREPFMARVSAIDRLSLRLTHGRNGNADKSSSNLPIISMGTSPSTNTGTIIGTVADFGNPLLRWEKTVTTNLGLDFGLLKNRISGKIDFYSKAGKDIMGLVMLPGAIGVTSQRFNNAEISNKGIEVQLAANVGEGRLRYNPLLTYAYNRNVVTRLNYPNMTVANLINGSGQVEGRPVGATYSFTYLGMVDSIPHLAGLNGVPTPFSTTALTSALGSAVLNYEGTTVSPHTLGFINSFSYGPIDVMVVAIGKFGGIYRNPTFTFSSSTGVGAMKTSLNKQVDEMLANDPNIPAYPKLGEANFYLWDRYTPYLNGLIQSSSYVELKEINLRYTMPMEWANKIRIAEATVFAQVRDLGLLYRANDKGYHPEWLPGRNRPVTSYTIGFTVKL